MRMTWQALKLQTLTRGVWDGPGFHMLTVEADDSGESYDYTPNREAQFPRCPEDQRT